MDCLFLLPVMVKIWAITIRAQHPRNPQTIGSDGMPLLPPAAAKAGMAVAARMLEIIVAFVSADNMALFPLSEFDS